MYDAVLVPTDGSPGAEAAVDHGIHMAAQNGATVHAVHVVDVTDFGDIAEGDEDLVAQGYEVVEPVVAKAEEAGLEVVETVLEGTPHERLLEYAGRKEIDAIAIGTHGKSGLSRVLLGSTAEEIVREAPVPVLTVREALE
ncbi:universal stress protein [Halomontanus rarus]|uniref:universal stress protein n=1 Tax=Halomontanus rarus TaxID=3034020 RepID=UPI001A9A1DB1